MNLIYNEDCLIGLKKLAENSIDGCITDPPYNYEFIGHKWDFNEIQRRINKVKNSKTLVKHIPYGSGLAGGVRNKSWYKKNAQNINDYREWTYNWSKLVFTVLKPGAYILVFNSSRTVAHVQVALEQAGFYARDILVWKKNSGIPKGINLEKRLEKENFIDSQNWKGWHSCFRNEWEAIALLQKPLEDNYSNTVKKWGVGVLKTVIDGKNFKSNIFENIERDNKQDFNMHCTIKPISLIKKLIEITVPLGNNKIILDPFIGSGTTAIAALELGINYLGFELVPEYHQIAESRIKKFLIQQTLFIL